MTDPELGVVSAAGAGLLALCRWAVGIWATVRREDIVAGKEAAAAQRAENARMVDALLAQARSNAELGGKIDGLSDKIETLVDWRDRTPVPIDPPQRHRTSPHGYRTPRPGEQDD